jgi:hypothetical protein
MVQWTGPVTLAFFLVFPAYGNDTTETTLENDNMVQVRSGGYGLLPGLSRLWE